MKKLHFASAAAERFGLTTPAANSRVISSGQSDGVGHTPETEWLKKG